MNYEELSAQIDSHNYWRMFEIEKAINPNLLSENKELLKSLHFDI